jgi:TMEM175 potassium channel family protein
VTLEPEHVHDTGRIEAFSDGVFAIAITLLVIEIGVPEVHEGGSLADDLRDQWPSYLGYVISFITIGVMWINHNHLFHDIARTDYTLKILNLLLLMGIAFVPFPTAVLAEYMQEDGDQLATAVVAFGGTFTVLALLFNALWLYASRTPGMLESVVSEQRIRTRTLRYLPGIFLYGITIPLAFVEPWISIGIYAGLSVLYLIPVPE